MRKILLACLLAVGIAANAQYNVSQNFDGTPPFDGLIYFGGSAGASTAVACSGNTSWAQQFSAANPQGGIAISFKDMDVPQTSTGQEVNISVKYRKTNAIGGILYLTLNTYDPVDDSWSLVIITSRALTNTAVNTCQTLSGTIPAGVLLEHNLPAGAKYSIGTYFIRNGGAGGTLYLDDLSISEEIVTTPPTCVALTAPTNGATINYGQYNFTWPKATGAVEYVLTVGTSPGAANVYDEILPASQLSTFVILAPNTTYYATLVPRNAVGNATGCTEIMFMTNNEATYCGPLPFSAVEPITRVIFADIDNATDATIDGAPAHEFFLSTKTDVERSATYTLTLNGNTGGNYTSYYVVFIDWNRNGVLDDSGEVYFANGSLNQTDTDGTIAADAITANITIPADAALGDTRMRIKKEYSPSVPLLSSGFPLPCSFEWSYGQAEDYTLTVKESALGTAVANNNTAAIYPNPFQDVLKITDVKGVKSISVTDVSGRLVKNFNVSAELNLAGLKSGLYIVTLRMEDGSVKSFKAIKK